MQLYEYSVLIRVPIVVAAESEKAANETIGSMSPGSIMKAAEYDTAEVVDRDLFDVR